MKSKKEIKQWLLENCVDEKGNLDLSGLNFSDFEGNINISCMKVKKHLYQGHQAVGGNLFQSWQAVAGDLFQDEQIVEKIEPKTAKERVETELAELKERRDKLFNFFATSKHDMLTIKSKELLNKQYLIMCDYIKVLEERLRTWWGM